MLTLQPHKPAGVRRVDGLPQHKVVSWQHVIWSPLLPTLHPFGPLPPSPTPCSPHFVPCGV